MTVGFPRIGVDLMGSDSSPHDLFSAVLQLSQQQPSIELVVFATAPVLDEISCPFEAVIAKDFITMDDDPLVAVRKKKDSSMALGLRLLKEKRIDAFVTTGNTGALLLSAKKNLSTLPGIERPALLTVLPTQGRDLAVLDVGANLAVKPRHMLQFAAMGIAYQKSRGVELPTVGLLNIGSEAQKGTPELRAAYAELESLNHDRMVFVGNIEGRDAFLGDIDVLVTEGFTGNIFLKTAEGISAFIWEELEETATIEAPPHLKNLLTKLRHRLHYAEYPGAILCGVDGIVVKCHGDASPEALLSGIKGAIRLAEHNFLERIKSQL
ncbi:MAG: phosphate acyltransferase PlsX [Verrucomicrobia bacterium]|nr:phosphate acyltransferase PlsX [Verrucomicrobiota bacterium]